MKIVFVADGDNKYGAPTSLYQLIQGLKKLDNSLDIDIIVSKSNLNDSIFKDADCTLHAMSYAPFYYSYPLQIWKAPIKYIYKLITYNWGRYYALKEFNKVYKNIKINIIHSNSCREDFGAMIASKYGIKHVCHIREFGDLDYKCFSLRKNYINYMNENTDRFIAVSEAVKAHWIRKGISENKIERIYNGVLKNDGYVEHSRDGYVKFVMLGSLNPTKGHLNALSAFAMLDDAYKDKYSFYIIGDGNKKYINDLRKTICKYRLEDNVFLLGYIKSGYNVLNEYDCGLMCSKSEAFGRTTVEYMMAGLPVIASNTGANPELVNDNVGLLYEESNIYDLAFKIQFMIDNAKIRKQMGENAYIYANEKFSSEVNARNIYELYLRMRE